LHKKEEGKKKEKVEYFYTRCMKKGRVEWRCDLVGGETVEPCTGGKCSAPRKRGEKRGAPSEGSVNCLYIERPCLFRGIKKKKEGDRRHQEAKGGLGREKEKREKRFHAWNKKPQGSFFPEKGIMNRKGRFYKKRRGDASWRGKLLSS